MTFSDILADGGFGTLHLFTSVGVGEDLDLLNEQEILDSNLQNCILGAAATNGWATVDEVTALDCSDSEISDLTGLDALTALTSLDLSGNEIDETAGLETLINLTSLNLSGNPELLCVDLDALELALGAGVVIRPLECSGGQAQAQQVQSLHNAQGQRVVKTVSDDPSTTLHFIYDQAGRVIAEIDATTGATTREYIYVNGIQVALVDDTATQDEATYFVHNDHLGTPQKITDEAQAVVWGASYEPFGEVTETASAIENNIRFPGQYKDDETGLHYNYFRDYDPSLGRYLESDPASLEGGLNTFIYGNNSPTKLIDPLGLFPFGDRCGDSGRSKFIPDQFPASCEAHDSCYGCSGKKKGKSKQQCDWEFLQDMTKECSRRGSAPYFDDGCMSTALYYYLGVSVGASGAFNNARSDCDDC